MTSLNHLVPQVHPTVQLLLHTQNHLPIALLVDVLKGWMHQITHQKYHMNQLTPENREKLEAWILNHFTANAFNTCSHQKLQSMTGEPLDITYKPEAVPTAVYTPIPVAHHWKERVKADLDRDVQLGIIEPVPQNTPTIWCSRMVITTAKRDDT